jgi:GT2 family glycosyltransferase
MFEVSVVIVNWNTKKFLYNCLRSVFRNTKEISYDIWVVDNASLDGSSDMVTSEFPTINLIKNKKNLGFAVGNNQAIAASEGKYILILNPDTELIMNSIKKMKAYMDKSERVGAVGCKLLNSDGSLQRSCHGHVNPIRAFTFSAGLHRFIRDGTLTFKIGNLLKNTFRTFVNLADYDSVLFPDSIDGACMLLSREALSDVGLLDEQFFMYWEDADLCYRLTENKWKVAYIPDTKIIHHGGQSSMQNYNKMALESWKSRALLYKKHHGSKSVIALRAAVIFGILIRLLLSLPGIIFKREGLNDRLLTYKDIFTWALRGEKQC